MPIKRHTDIFDDETVELLTAVYAAALRTLKLDGDQAALSPWDEEISILICHRLVDLARAGERDPQVLLHDVVAGFQVNR